MTAPYREPLGTGDKIMIIATYVTIAATAVLFAVLVSMLLSSCTIRGKESCSDVGGCDMRRADAAVPGGTP